MHHIRVMFAVNTQNSAAIT